MGRADPLAEHFWGGWKFKPHFFVFYSFEGESNSLKHLKIVLEIIQTARGVMPVAHLEATEVPSFPASELSSNWKKTQPSHYLISLKTKTDPVRWFVLFVFFFVFLIEQALLC